MTGLGRVPEYYELPSGRAGGPADVAGAGSRLAECIRADDSRRRHQRVRGRQREGPPSIAIR